MARRAVVVEPNEAGETPLIAAAERGHLEVVLELLRHLDAEGVAAKNRSGYDALHVGAREGHHGETLCLILQLRFVCVLVEILSVEPAIACLLLHVAGLSFPSSVTIAVAPCLLSEFLGQLIWDFEIS